MVMSITRTGTYFVAALLLVSWGLAESAPAEAKDWPSHHEDKSSKVLKTTLRGLATLHHSVFGGTIEIYDTKGKLVYRFEPSMHPTGGYFELPIREKRLMVRGRDDDSYKWHRWKPSRFKRDRDHNRRDKDFRGSDRRKHARDDDDRDVVRVEGGLAFRLVLRNGISQDLPGKRVTLIADVSGFDPVASIVYLNPLTTLIAFYRDAHPYLTLTEAEADVRAYLAFPDHLSVGLHVSTGVDHFDLERLLQEAWAHRHGLTGYLKSLVPEIDIGLVNSFAVPLAASPTQNALVCVNTWAWDEDTDINEDFFPFIQVGADKYYGAPNSIDDMQVLILRRATLLPDMTIPGGFNRNYPGGSSSGSTARASLKSFLKTLTPDNIVIVRGGVFGGNPIQDPDGLADALSPIGASSFAIPDARFPSNPPNAPTTWSVIGIPGSDYGDAYQKGWVSNRFSIPATVTSTICPENVPAANFGNLNGYFTADTTGEMFTYTPTEFPTFDTNFYRFAQDHDPRVNTMLVGGNQPVTATLPAEFVGGFHRVQVDGRTGQVVVSAMIGTHRNVNGQVVLDPDGVSEFAWESGQPRQGTVGDTIVLMTSVGTAPIASLPQIANGDPRLTWSTGTQIYAQDYNASFHILNTLTSDDRYSMAGVGTPDPKLISSVSIHDYARESSLQVTPATPDVPNPPVGRISGYFKRSRQGYLVPVMGSPVDPNQDVSPNSPPSADNYNSDGSPKALNILQIAYQPPSQWPFTGTFAYDSALDDFAVALSLSGAPNSPRDKYISEAVDWASKAGTTRAFDLVRDSGQFPGFTRGDYTAQEWQEVQSELVVEFDWLADIHPYLSEARQVLDDSEGIAQVNLKAVGDAVYDKNAPNSGSTKETHVLGELFSVAGDTLIAAISISEPEVGVALTAGMGLYGLAQQTAADNNGKSADRFQSEVNQLSSDVQQKTTTAIESTESIRVLLATDYGKLSESAPLAFTSWNGAQLGSNAYNTQYEQSATQNFYGTLFRHRWRAYTLEDPTTNQKFKTPGEKVCEFDCVFGFCTKTKVWTGVPASAQFTFRWGYDGSGNPIDQLWFWGRNYNTSSGASSKPSSSTTDPLFEAQGSMGGTGVGLAPSHFWWQKNPAKRFFCSNGNGPFDSRATGKSN